MNNQWTELYLSPAQQREAERHRALVDQLSQHPQAVPIRDIPLPAAIELCQDTRPGCPVAEMLEQIDEWEAQLRAAAISKK
jgi:hypothetical protein